MDVIAQIGAVFDSINNQVGTLLQYLFLSQCHTVRWGPVDGIDIFANPANAERTMQGQRMATGTLFGFGRDHDNTGPAAESLQQRAQTTGLHTIVVREKDKGFQNLLSERLDLNQRPLPPQGSALPDCATPRIIIERNDFSNSRPRTHNMAQLFQFLFELEQEFATTVSCKGQIHLPF